MALFTPAAVHSLDFVLPFLEPDSTDIRSIRGAAAIAAFAKEHLPNCTLKLSCSHLFCYYSSARAANKVLIICPFNSSEDINRTKEALLKREILHQSLRFSELNVLLTTAVHVGAVFFLTILREHSSTESERTYLGAAAIVAASFVIVAVAAHIFNGYTAKRIDQELCKKGTKKDIEGLRWHLKKEADKEQEHLCRASSLRKNLFLLSEALYGSARKRLAALPMAEN